METNPETEINLETLKKDIQALSPDWYIAWFPDKIEAGQGLQLFEALSLENLVELRAFNKSTELRAWRSKGKLFSRHREDSDLQFIDTETIIRSTIVEKLPGLQKGSNRYTIKRRNYIWKNEIGGAYCFDSRFVSIDPLNQEKSCAKKPN